MGKLDELRKTMGQNVNESASRREAPAPVSAPSLTSARTAGVVRSKNALEIAVDRIVADEDQPREDFEPEALGRLASSLKTRGQLQPIRVRWDEGRGVYVLICGERRWRAAQLAGMSTLSCVVTEGVPDPSEVLVMQLVENAVREDLAPIEQARAFKVLMSRMGWSGNRLAQELGISQPSVVSSLALLDLPASVQRHVDEGTLAPSTAYEIGKLGDAVSVAAVAEEVVQGGMTRSEAVARVRRANKPKGRGAKAIKDRVFRKTLGRVTVELRKPGDAAAVLSLLEEAAADVRRELQTSESEAA